MSFALAGVALTDGQPVGEFFALSDDGRSIQRFSGPDPEAGNLVVPGQPVYQIEVLGEDGRRVTFSPRAAAGAQVESIGRGVRLKYPASSQHPASVACTFVARDGRIECRIAVEPRSGFALVRVQFPVLVVRLPVGRSGADDELVLPFYDGSLIRNPGKALRVGNGRSARYPGSLAAQFLALVDPQQGLYIACHDGSGHVKEMGFRRVEEGLRLAATHLMPLRRGAAWKLEYPVVLQRCAGSWMRAADLYKAWAVKQRWCAMTLAERGNIPQWVRSGPFFHAVSLRNRPDGKTWVNFLPSLPDYIRSYHQALGWPVCAMIMAWEKHGPWITPDYFPPYGGEQAFKQATQAILRQGDYTLVFLSGLKWTLERAALDYRGWEEFQRRGRPWAVRGAGGDVLISGRPDAGVGRYAQICPATALAREILAGATARCVEMGVLGVQVDQVVGGAMPPCYAEDHGHPPGPGKWLSEAVYAAFEAAVNAGKKLSREYAFAIEEPNELFIPLLDCYHARDYQFGRWPRGGPGKPYPIPLFAYLYHEYALGYGGDSASLIKWPSPYLTLAQALNAVTGKTPGGCVWSQALAPEQVHASIIDVTRQHCRLLKAGAGKWLLLGRMIDFDFVDAPVVAVRAGKQQFEFHAVQSSAWAATDGTAAWLFANITGQDQQVDVRLDDRGVLGGRAVGLWKVRGEDGRRELITQGGRLPRSVRLSLAPYSMTLITAG